jgi:two-component system LytT family response regulator
MKRIRALIVEDEGPARRRLRELVDRVADLECVAEASDGPAAVEAIERLHPDLVFLDVHLPGASGMDVLQRINHEPHVIFTTAYDRYAVAAFEMQALDYLLKPFGEKRFEAAVERARAALTGASQPSPIDRLKSGFREEPLKRLFVRERGRIVPVAVSDIVRIEACDDYARLHVGGRRFLVQVRMKEFEARLDPGRFIRVHRSHIVNLDHVAAFRPLEGSRLEVALDDGTTVVASRRRSRGLRKLTV